MFRSVKLKNIHLTVFSLLCLLVFTIICLLALRAGAPDTVEINGESYSLRAEDEADIAAFINVCGYEVGESLYEREITVPKHWNDTYIRYNELQQQQGLDLVPYKGKSARELCYAVADSDKTITLLLGEERIIAAHICDADGENMRPFINE